MFRRLLASVTRAFRDRPVAETAFVLAIAHVLVMLIAQARTLGWNLTIVEQHHWRQSFTYGVAWNFANTGWDFFHPRMLMFLNGTNVVGMEAPLYPFICALFLRATAGAELVCRLITWSALIAALVAITLTFFRGRAWARAGFLFAAGLTPLVWSEFRQMQPDGLMVGSACVAAAFLYRWGRDARARDLVIGAALATVAMLAKNAAVGIMPALVLFAVWRRWRSVRFLAVSALAFVPAAVVFVGWDRWAAHLVVTYTKVIVISVQHDPKDMLASLTDGGALRLLLTFFAGNYACCFWLFPAVLVGIADALSTPEKRASGVPFLAWLVVVIIMLACFGDRLHSNWYYATPLFPPLAVFAGQGLAAAAEALDGRPLDSMRRFALIVVPAALAFGMWRMQPFTTFGEERRLAVHVNERLWSDTLGYAVLAFVLVAATGLAQSRATVRPPRAFAVVAVALLAISAGPARRTAEDTLAFFAATYARKPFVADLLALRTAVDRLSAPGDKVVVDQKELAFLAFVRRNGWSDGDDANPDTLAQHVASGAKLFVHFAPGVPPKTVAQRPIAAKTDAWTIYCLTERCPP